MGKNSNKRRWDKGFDNTFTQMSMRKEHFVVENEGGENSAGLDEDFKESGLGILSDPKNFCRNNHVCS